MKPEKFLTAKKKLEEQKERLCQYNEVLDDLAKRVLLSGLMLSQSPITSNLRSVLTESSTLQAVLLTWREANPVQNAVTLSLT
jgi:hypothetical protein